MSFLNRLGEGSQISYGQYLPGSNARKKYCDLKIWNVFNGKVVLVQSHTKPLERFFVYRKGESECRVSNWCLGRSNRRLGVAQEQLLSSLEDTYIKLIKTDCGQLSIKINQRIRGGVKGVKASSEVDFKVLYERAFFDLRELLEGLLNQKIFDEFISLVSDEKIKQLNAMLGINEECISMYFLPESLKEKLISVNKYYVNLMDSSSHNVDKMKMANAQYKNDLIGLRSIKLKSPIEFEGWKSLEDLFDLPMIKKLSEEKIIQLYSVIDSNDPRKIRAKVFELVPLEERNLANSILKEKGKKNLNTVLARIPKERKKKGFFDYWDENFAGLSGKGIRIRNPDLESDFTGGVIELVSITEGGSGREFYLKGGRRVAVVKTEDESCKLILQDTQCVSLVNSLLSANRPVGEIWEVGVVHSSKLFQGGLMLSEGSYFCEQVENEYIGEKVKRKPSKSFLFHSKTDPEKKILLMALANSKTQQIAKLILVDKLKKIQKSFAKKEFERRFFQKITRSVFEKKLPVNEINEIIEIVNYIDDGVKKSRAFESIQDKETKMVHYLSQSDNKKNFLKILDNLHANSLKFIELDVFFKVFPELEGTIDHLADVYVNTLNYKINYQDIVFKLVLTANYLMVITKWDALSTSKGMQLLIGANQNLKKIKDKDAILFVGNTGSGKSTSICYLLGAEMDEKKNIAGENVFYVVEDGINKYPAIGQSLGSSETSYLEGYTISSEKYLDFDLPNSDNLVICDAPGFRDTRGDIYDICTDYSFDQFAKAVSSLKALVMNIPIQAFQMDRAEPFIDLVRTVRERFPGSFSLSNTTKSSGLFLLITKQGQVEQSVIDNFSNRIAQLHRDSFLRVKDLKRKLEEKKNVELELFAAEERLEIWSAVKEMISMPEGSKKVHFIDLFDSSDREDLLKLYSSFSFSLVQKSFALSTDIMKLNFWNNIKMSLHTWEKLLFHEYFNGLPERLKRIEEGINATYETLQELGSRKKIFVDRLNIYNEKISSKKRTIQKIGEIINNKTFDSTSKEVKERLNESLKESRTEEINRLKDRMKELNSKSGVVLADIEDLKAQICEIEQNIKAEKGFNESDIEKIKNYSVGTEKEVLISFEYKEGDFSIFSNAKLLVDGKPQVIPEDFSPALFSGKLLHSFDIDGEKVLIPDDNKLIKSFYKKRGFFQMFPFSNDNFQSAAGGSIFKSTVSGQHYKMQERKGGKKGRKVTYDFITDWKEGRKNFPHFKVTHLIPKKLVHYATIQNSNSDIQEKEKSIKSQEAQIEDKKNQIVKKCNEILFLNLELQKIKADLKLMEKEVLPEDLPSILEFEKRDLERLVKAPPVFDDIALENSIDSEKAILEQKKQKKQKILLEKRSLAIAILSQKEVPLLLRECARSMLELVSNIVRYTKESVQDLTESFIKTFDDPDRGYIKLISNCESFLKEGKAGLE